MIESMDKFISADFVVLSSSKFFRLGMMFHFLFHYQNGFDDSIGGLVLCVANSALPWSFGSLIFSA